MRGKGGMAVFRGSDTETGSVLLNYEWAVRIAPPEEIIHVCGPAYSSTCLEVEEGEIRLARCNRCGVRISYTALARLLKRAPIAG